MSTATILLVDDDDDVREITALFLRDTGYHIIEAASGRAALGLLDANPAIDLLIADFAMPEMAGTELLERVRAKHPDVGVVFITGYAQERLGENFRSEIVVRKPFTMEQLALAVRRALD
jgi:two-component system cell cycle sensor histidine kinase/response regulator CckA